MADAGWYVGVSTNINSRRLTKQLGQHRATEYYQLFFLLPPSSFFLLASILRYWFHQSWMSNHCALCGKADANLKACKACKLVKYCGVECQVAHRPAHKKACKEKAKELFDEKLYALPPKKEECPICMIPLPCDDNECTYMACCGKLICEGCRYCLTRDCCPFCNTAASCSHEVIKKVSERIELESYNDPAAMVMLSGFYSNGQHGLPVDQSKPGSI
eukprot:scaffold42413_cov23-Cyclotella_meneghiniana.AAC.2